MRVMEKRDGRIVVELRGNELEILTNALNEVCHGLDVWDFPIRMGAEKSEVLKLLHQIQSALPG